MRPPVSIPSSRALLLAAFVLLIPVYQTIQAAPYNGPIISIFTTPPSCVSHSDFILTSRSLIKKLRREGATANPCGASLTAPPFSDDAPLTGTRSDLGSQSRGIILRLFYNAPHLFIHRLHLQCLSLLYLGPSGTSLVSFTLDPLQSESRPSLPACPRMLSVEIYPRKQPHSAMLGLVP